MLAGQQADELSDEDIANEIVTLLFAVSMAASTRVTRIPRSYTHTYIIIIVARNRKRVRRVSRLLFTYCSYF